jgi:hypothetical protein
MAYQSSLTRRSVIEPFHTCLETYEAMVSNTELLHTVSCIANIKAVLDARQPDFNELKTLTVLNLLSFPYSGAKYLHWRWDSQNLLNLC